MKLNYRSVSLFLTLFLTIRGQSATSTSTVKTIPASSQNTPSCKGIPTTIECKGGINVYNRCGSDPVCLLPCDDTAGHKYVINYNGNNYCSCKYSGMLEPSKNLDKCGLELKERDPNLNFIMTSKQFTKTLSSASTTTFTGKVIHTTITSATTSTTSTEKTIPTSTLLSSTTNSGTKTLPKDLPTPTKVSIRGCQTTKDPYFSCGGVECINNRRDFILVTIDNVINYFCCEKYQSFDMELGCIFNENKLKILQEECIRKGYVYSLEHRLCIPTTTNATTTTSSNITTFTGKVIPTNITTSTTSTTSSVTSPTFTGKTVPYNLYNFVKVECQKLHGKVYLSDDGKKNVCFIPCKTKTLTSTTRLKTIPVSSTNTKTIPVSTTTTKAIPTNISSQSSYCSCEINIGSANRTSFDMAECEELAQELGYIKEDVGSTCIPATITVTEKVKETITQKEIVTVTVTEDITPTPNVKCAGKWAQCGGVGFNGPTCCESGTTCHKYNEYYSQCM